MRVALSICDPDPLLGDLASRRATTGSQRTENLERSALGLTRDQERLSAVNLTEKFSGAEMAIFNPQITGFNRLEHRPKQRAFLSGAILTRKHIGDQARSRFIHHQGFSRQGASRNRAQHLKPMLGRFDAVAIDNFDSLALEPRRSFAIQVLDQGTKLTGTGAD